jgi:hypothetical protein
VNAGRSRLTAAAVLAGTVVAAIVVAVASLRYPAILQLPGAGPVLAVTVIMLLGYAAGGAWALRHPSPGHGVALVWGTLGGAMWSAEIWCGGPAKLSHSLEQALGALFVVLALAATVTGGILAAVRFRRAGPAWQAGLFSGLISGLFVYIFAVDMTLATLPILASRGDYQAQFAHSHAPDMATFLVGDILAAVAAHLVINLVVGLAGGGLGVLIARAARPAATVP